jgi:tripartite-type tricarboxylate transporter receptor subunit TctC
MSHVRFVFSAMLAAASLALAGPRPASAQAYPNKSITMVVAFAAGGVADGIARLIGEKVSKRLGQNVVIQNRGGAGGNIAAKLVAGAAPDGYTILVTTTALAINQTLYANKGFSTSDFKTVAIAASSPESFTTYPSNPGKNIGEFIKAMKGKPINFGTAGTGSGSHIAAAYFFKELAKLPATHVPFLGGGPAANAALANQINLLEATLGGNVAAQIKGGKLKGLAVLSPKRVAVTPNVPTLAEGGYPNFYAASWVGFFVPAKTDAKIALKLNAAIDQSVKDAVVQQRLAALGFDPVTGSQPEAEQHFNDEIARWGKMVKTLGLSIK